MSLGSNFGLKSSLDLKLVNSAFQERCISQITGHGSVMPDTLRCSESTSNITLQVASISPPTALFNMVGPWVLGRFGIYMHVSRIAM